MATLQKTGTEASVSEFQAMSYFNSNPLDRIASIRSGLPATRVQELSRCMGISTKHLADMLQLSAAAISRRAKAGRALSSGDSERVLGIETLIWLTRKMITESGEPHGFDAPLWVGKWLDCPLPALGGIAPGTFMDTIEGQRLVAELLSTSQSGAYV